MHIFAYGIVSVAAQDNQMYNRMMRLIAEEAWVLNASLYVTAMETPALVYGKDKVIGKLFFAEDNAMKTLMELAENLDRLNPPYTYLLKPVKVYTEKGAYDAYAFMYSSNEGLTKIDSGKWTE
jgi:gamma-glutamylcyclotransferase (GGCT)/AIG2-like uncharacterized protein YtfP